MQFSHLIFSLAVAVGIVEAIGSTNNPLLRVQRDLERREVPPCTKCPESDKHWLAKVNEPKIAYKAEPQSAVKGDDWLPKACNYHGYVCIVIKKGISYSSGGFKGYPNVGHWQRSDGSQVYVSTYWQSTIQFVGSGVTFNIYPAHCTVYIVSKGSKAQVKAEGAVKLSGSGSKCLGNAKDLADADKAFGVIEFSSKDDE